MYISISIPFPFGVYRHSLLSLSIHLGSVNIQLKQDLSSLLDIIDVKCFSKLFCNEICTLSRIIM